MSDAFVRLAKHLRDTRLEQKLSQEFVAQAAGISVKTLQRAELQGVMSAETAKALCAVLKIDPDLPKAPVKPALFYQPKPIWALYQQALRDTKPIVLMTIMSALILGVMGSGALMMEGNPNKLSLFDFFFILVIAFFLALGVLAGFCYLLRFCELYHIEQRRQRVYALKPTLDALLKDLQHLIEDPALTFEQSLESMNTHLKAAYDLTKSLPSGDLNMLSLRYMENDLTRGISPRKKLMDYLRAQEVAITLVFQPTPALEYDFDQEVRRLRQNVSVFAG